MKKDADSFRLFGQFRICSGDLVTVRESILPDTAWIGCVADNSGPWTPDLTKADARKLIRVLQKFIDTK